jgi:rSAM/selenodomain-associated transferase 1
VSRGWLIVFAKAPRPGLVKTRMSPPFSLAECAELYAEMLADVLEASAGFGASLDLELVIAYHPPDAVEDLLPRVSPGYRLQPQRGDDLGQRMAFAASEAGAAGAERILMRGSDSPGLSLRHFEAALARLDAGDDLVLTPDQGGGYALIGLRRPQPRLFDLVMSTRSVMGQTLACAARAGLRSSRTIPSFDLDEAGDIRLVLDLPAAEKADLCPRTVQFLAAHAGAAVL